MQQYSANTGQVFISTANPNRDGSGSMGAVITGASGGTVIQLISISAIDTTTQGMIRFFIDDGSSARLVKEVQVPASTPSGTVPCYQSIIYSGFTLQSGHILKVSTENNESFSIIATGVDWANCSCPS